MCVCVCFVDVVIFSGCVWMFFFDISEDVLNTSDTCGKSLSNKRMSFLCVYLSRFNRIKHIIRVCLVFEHFHVC